MDFDRLYEAAHDPDEDTRADIRRYRTTFELPVDDAVVEELFAAYRAGRHEGGEWETPEEAVEVAERAARLRPVRAAAREYTDPGGPGEHEFAGRWISWDGGQRLNLAFAARVDEHRARWESDLVRVHAARFRLAELEQIAERIAEDHDELRAAGIEATSWGVDPRDNVATIEARGPDEQRARRLLVERYGPALRLDWLGAESEVAVDQPWGAWSTDPTGRVITVRYAGNAACPPLDPLVTETVEEVRITARDRYPNGGAVTLIGAVREVRVELAAPLGDRRLVDGTNGRVWT